MSTLSFRMTEGRGSKGHVVGFDAIISLVTLSTSTSVKFSKQGILCFELVCTMVHEVNPSWCSPLLCESTLKILVQAADHEHRLVTDFLSVGLSTVRQCWTAVWCLYRNYLFSQIYTDVYSVPTVVCTGSVKATQFSSVLFFVHTFSALLNCCFLFKVSPMNHGTWGLTVIFLSIMGACLSSRRRS